MNSKSHFTEQTSVFLVKSALYITTLAVIFLTPFSINNFIQGRLVLGLGSLSIVILCALNTWNCYKNRFQPKLIFFGLVPFIIFFLVYSIKQQGLVAVFWSYPAVLMLYFTLPGKYAWIANTLLVGLVIPEAWGILDHSSALRFAITLVTTSCLAAIFITFITKQQNKLEKMAITDALTGLFNRSYFEIALHKALLRYKRSRLPMALLMIDLDHFKLINDHLGHAAGDKVLKGIGNFFLNRLRSSDTAFRIGGEEFVVLLYDVTAENALQVANELRREIEFLNLLDEKKITASIGVSVLNDEDDDESWLKRGDQYLYQAKDQGRNTVAF